VKQSELFDAIARAFGMTSPRSGDSETSLSELPTSIRSLKILLAEDSVANQMLAIGLLERKWKHDVTVANNGIEAVALVQTQPFDLVLMDVQMPEMDGLEATAEIRRIEPNGRLNPQSPSRLPIVAMTAHAMKGDREKCLDAGMDAYVSKPIRATELNKVIQQFFDSEAESDANQTSPTVPEEKSIDAADAQQHGVIDWSKALDTVLGERELLRDVVQSFLAECPQSIGQIDQAIQQQDHLTAGRLVHRIRGEMLVLAIPTDTAQQLEAFCKSGDQVACVDCFTRLQTQLERVMTVLSQFERGDFEPA
jgi:CheY-like chemotaxis protein